MTISALLSVITYCLEIYYYNLMVFEFSKFFSFIFCLQCDCCKMKDNNEILSTFPDLCIAYKLHLECGVEVNLYDWLQVSTSVILRKFYFRLWIFILIMYFFSLSPIKSTKVATWTVTTLILVSSILLRLFFRDRIQFIEFLSVLNVKISSRDETLMP